MENALNYLQGSLVQQRQSINRQEAEYLLQQMLGPIVGIERVSDEQLRKRLPMQFKMDWLEV